VALDEQDRPNPGLTFAAARRHRQGDIMTVTQIRENARRAKARRERIRRLRAELEDYRTPAERAELDAILARHDTTLSDVLRSAA
jgi:hypothetical protein